MTSRTLTKTTIVAVGAVDAAVAEVTMTEAAVAVAEVTTETTTEVVVEVMIEATAAVAVDSRSAPNHLLRTTIRHILESS